MDNLEAGGMQIVTNYAPVRILLLGLVRGVFGLMILGLGVLTIWATYGGDMRPTRPGDMPAWWMFLVGAAFAFGGLALLIGGLGRMVSAFVRNCYFKAGPGGMTIRLPKQGWFGRFQVVEYNYRWGEISNIVRFVQRVNLIPVSSELRIDTKAGASVPIARHYFSDSVKQVQEKLLSIASIAGH